MDLKDIYAKLTVSNEDEIDWDAFFDEINEDVSETIGIKTTDLTELLADLDNFTDYRNITNKSNIVGYKYGDDWLLIKFNGGSLYLYTTKNVKTDELNLMISLAIQGSGLNGYINKFIGSRYTGRNYKNIITVSSEDMDQEKSKLVQILTAFQNGSNQGSDKHLIMDNVVALRLTYADIDWVKANIKPSTNQTLVSGIPEPMLSKLIYATESIKDHNQRILKDIVETLHTSITCIAEADTALAFKLTDHLNLLGNNVNSLFNEYSAVSLNTDTTVKLNEGGVIEYANTLIGLLEYRKNFVITYETAWMNKFYVDDIPLYGRRGSLRTPRDPSIDKLIITVGDYLKLVEIEYSRVSKEILQVIDTLADDIKYILDESVCNTM